MASCWVRSPVQLRSVRGENCEPASCHHHQRQQQRDRCDQPAGDGREDDPGALDGRTEDDGEVDAVEAAVDLEGDLGQRDPEYDEPGRNEDQAVERLVDHLTQTDHGRYRTLALRSETPDPTEVSPGGTTDRTPPC